MPMPFRFMMGFENTGKHGGVVPCGPASRPWLWARSEEHTSELQSLRHLVCRLLLEKKKTRIINQKIYRYKKVKKGQIQCTTSSKPARQWPTASPMNQHARDECETPTDHHQLDDLHA